MPTASGLTALARVLNFCRIRVSCNPAVRPIRVPAGDKIFTAPEGSMRGDLRPWFFMVVGIDGRWSIVTGSQLDDPIPKTG